MNNQLPRDPTAQGNMVPPHSAPSGYHDPRSQQPVSGRPHTGNSQQPSPMQQTFGAASWQNPSSGAQYYGNAQYAPQNASYNQGYYMPNPQQMANAQQMPGYPHTNFAQQNFQEPFDPAAETLRQWVMGTTRSNNSFVPNNTPNSSYGSNMQFSGQHYPAQQASLSQAQFQQGATQQMQAQQAPVHQTYVQQSYAQPEDDDKHDSYAEVTSYDDYAGYGMDDDPSAQLMAELNGASPSPTPQTHQPPQLFNSKDEEMTEDLTASTADSLQPADDWSSVFPEQPIDRLEGDVSQSFENEIISTESENILQRQLGEQVDQVIDDLNDADMQDLVPGEQISISRTPEHTYITSSTDRDDDVGDETGDYVEDSSVEEELAAPVDNIEHIGKLPAPPIEMSDNFAEEVVSEDADVSEHDGIDNDAEQEITETNNLDTASTSNQKAHDSATETPNLVMFEGYELAISPWKTIKKKVMSKEDKDLHQKATKLIPHHLPETRYWAAVLVHSVQPHKAKVEKDFIWMKGSRRNTVETIYNKYKEVTVQDRHQILFCGEPPEFYDTLEELDVCSDKLVVFRAHVQPEQVIEID